MPALSDTDLANPPVRLVAPEELDIRPIEEQRDTECPRSELLRAGEPTGKFVPGIVREAVVAVGNRFLAFMTDDIPYEEFLSICYLESDFSTIEVLRLGTMYSTGSFRELGPALFLALMSAPVLKRRSIIRAGYGVSPANRCSAVLPSLRAL